MDEAKHDTEETSTICVIVLGMAGSGKTSLVTKMLGSTQNQYAVNLDPACANLPFFANIGTSYKGINHICFNTTFLFLLCRHSRYSQIQGSNETIQVGSQWCNCDFFESLCNKISFSFTIY